MNISQDGLDRMNWALSRAKTFLEERQEQLF